MTPPGQAITATRGVAQTPGLAALLGCQLLEAAKVKALPPGSFIVAWGRKASSIKAHRLAAATGLPLCYIEDGFARSVGLGDRAAPLSIIVDRVGVYYDATRPSELETLIDRPLTAAQAERARELTKSWRAGRISKYNHLREEPPPAGNYVLVVDQTFGDCSIAYGLATKESFDKMLQAALVENEDCLIVIKTHPDVFAGRKNGHFNLFKLAKNPRILILANDVHPVALLEGARAVYTVTSQLGFEGLLWGKRVRTFGMPFYAGYGLTEDELPAPARRAPASVEQLTHAVLIDYARYLNPETGLACSPEELIKHLSLQRQQRRKFDSTVYALGFSRWKRKILRDFLQGSQVLFVKKAASLPNGATLALWGGNPPPAGLAPGIKLLRIEDGFLRSVGLGASLVRPLSWCLDRRGIYYDSTSPSELEEVLLTGEFGPELLLRARELRKAIVTAGITKYNTGRRTWTRPAGIDRVIVVPGQVESDASLRYGAPDIKTNMGLLAEVRKNNPGAYIVYKPHPDVQAGLRRSGNNEESALILCDEIVLDIDIASLLAAADEVHVLTSLAGFEALLRGKRVITYGQPFYAGWGLTSDLAPVARRTRKLSLDELTAAVLILYPTYISRSSGGFTTAERALAELVAWRDTKEPPAPLLKRAIKSFVRQVKAAACRLRARL